jgi:hypothetical protein
MMRPLPSILAAMLLVQTLAFCADEALDPRIAELHAKLEPLIKKHYPDAVMKAEGQQFSASGKVMTFSIHNVNKLGKIATEAHPQQGPSDTGFTLSVIALKEPYGGAAVRPQSVREAYWETHLGFWKKGEHGVTYNFSYGVNTPRDFMKELYTIFEAYKKD